MDNMIKTVEIYLRILVNSTWCKLSSFLIIFFLCYLFILPVHSTNNSTACQFSIILKMFHIFIVTTLHTV